MSWGNPSNLPPGCTDRDIERAAGDGPDICDICGKESDNLDSDKICPKCKEEKED